ncbi:hypothetical protein D3C80_1046800 [compost metagenome]
MVGDRVHEGVATLQITIVKLERVVQTGANRINPIHLSDSDLYHCISRKNLIKRLDIVAVQVMGIKDSEVADFFTIKETLGSTVHG